MKIIHVKSVGILSDDALRRLGEIVYPDVTTAVTDLKQLFPRHVVSANDGYIRVTNSDGSLTVALFKEETAQPSWIKTGPGFRSNK